MHIETPMRAIVIKPCITLAYSSIVFSVVHDAPHLFQLHILSDVEHLDKAFIASIHKILVPISFF
jgi:hypothetical protein